MNGELLVTKALIIGFHDPDNPYEWGTMLKKGAALTLLNNQLFKNGFFTRVLTSKGFLWVANDMINEARMGYEARIGYEA